VIRALFETDNQAEKYEYGYFNWHFGTRFAKARSRREKLQSLTCQVRLVVIEA